MLTLTSPQQTAVDADPQTVRWLFEVTPVGHATLYWSTDDVTVSAQAYAYRIKPESFAGVVEHRSRKEGGLRVPTTCDFAMLNVELYDRGYFAGASVICRELINGVECRRWKMTVYTCTPGQGTLDFSLRDFLQPFLDGDWPLTAMQTDVDKAANKDACLPVLIGEAFIPIELIVNASTPYFVLGAAGTYTVSEVSSPKLWDDSASSWLATEYTMTQGTVTVGSVTCRTLRPIINDSDGDLVADAMGFWLKPGRLAMPTRYSCSTTATLDFAEAIDWYLQQIGIASADIDATSFAAAGVVYAAQGLTCNGGWTKRQSRQSALASLLNQCHSTIDVRDKIYLRPLSKAPVATISDVLCDQQLSTTFRYTPVPPSGQAVDSGYIVFSPPSTPADTTISALVSIATTQANPVSQSLAFNLVHDSIICQKLGRLYHQRSMPGIAHPVWSADLSNLALQPDDVVTIDNPIYGGTYPVLIDEILHERTGGLRVNGIRYGHTLDDFEDITGLSAITLPGDDLSAGWQPDPDATKGAPAGTLVGGIDAQLIANATTAVEEMTADNKLTPLELQQCRVGWDAIAADRTGLDTQAAALGLTTQKNAYDQAFVTLADYLNGGVPWVSGIPAWLSDANIANGVTINIVGATFRSQLSTYDTARSTLLTAIVDASANSIRLSLTNSAHVIPCTADGTPTSFSGATTTATVYRGAADDSANWTFNAVKTNVTASEAATSRTQTVTVISADVGYIDITASRSGYASVTGRFSLSKAKAGTNGTNGIDGTDGLDGDDGAALIRAGFGADYRLRVNETAGGNAVVFYHKDATPGANLGAGYSGTLRTGLYQSANGIGIGYHDMATGAWVDSILLNGSTGSAMLDGNLDTGGYIYATGRHDGGGFYACVTGIPDNTNDLGGYYFNPAHTALRSDTLTGIALHATATTGTAIGASVGAGTAVHGAASGANGMGGYFTASGGAKAAVFYGGAVDFGSCTIMTATTAKVTNLHADYLDGYDAGNGSYQLPINNGVLNAGLNADFLDGSHASAFAGVSHTHWLTHIYNDGVGSYKAKFKYSTDGTTWENIWLWRNDW